VHRAVAASCIDQLVAARRALSTHGAISRTIEPIVACADRSDREVEPGKVNRCHVITHREHVIANQVRLLYYRCVAAGYFDREVSPATTHAADRQCVTVVVPIVERVDLIANSARLHLVRPTWLTL
jgi:hypothetical protein